MRYEAFGESIGSGHCYCGDCRRASGSGFIPFMGFPADAVRFTGEAREFRSKAANGGDAVRNRCAQCMSLVFGGEIGKSDSYTLYAGSLDDPSAFHPTIAIFAEGRPDWARHPARLQGLRPSAGLGIEECPIECPKPGAFSAMQSNFLWL